MTTIKYIYADRKTFFYNGYMISNRYAGSKSYIITYAIRNVLLNHGGGYDFVCPFHMLILHYIHMVALHHICNGIVVLHQEKGQPCHHKIKNIYMNSLRFCDEVKCDRNIIFGYKIYNIFQAEIMFNHFYVFHVNVFHFMCSQRGEGCVMQNNIL